MELRQLEYFVAVADTLSFTRAAESLHVSQPPLSRQIALLEKDLGVTLFTRTSRKVNLTAAGRALAEEARRILAGAQQLRMSAESAAQGIIGAPLRISAVPTAFVEFLPGVVSELRHRHAAIPVQITCQDIAAIEADLYAGSIDVAVTRGFRPSGMFDAHAVRTESLVAAVSTEHPLADNGRIRVRELSGQPLALVSRDVAPEYVDTIITVCRDEGFSPHITFQSSDYLVQLGMASSGLAIAVMPEPLHHIGFPGVRFLDIIEPALQTTLYVSQAESNPCPYFQEICDLAAAWRAPAR